MRIHCFQCGKSVSNELPEDTMLRATAACPECAEKRPDNGEDIRYLLSFVPPWAQTVPEGLPPTSYGTLSAEGDKKVKARVDKIRQHLAEGG